VYLIVALPLNITHKLQGNVVTALSYVIHAMDQEQIIAYLVVNLFSFMQEAASPLVHLAITQPQPTHAKLAHLHAFHAKSPVLTALSVAQGHIF
jgi:hypothetical protein